MLSSLFRPSADVFSELNRLQGVLEQVLQPGGQTSIRALSGATFPVINVGTTPEAIEVMALAPGIDPNALQITVDRGLLIISGQRQSSVPGRNGSGQSGGQGATQGQQGQQGGQGDDINVYAQERFTGSFRRVLSLPEDADPGRVQANYRDGMLRITVSRRESTRPRRIEVS